MNILITGANGFLGHLISQKILSANNKIIVCARSKNKLLNFSKSFKKKIIYWNLKSSFKNILSDVDVVIHTMSPPKSSNKKDFIIFNSINKKFIKEVANFNIKKFIYLSSVQIYGSKLKGIITENKKINIESFYAQSKYLAELNILKFIPNYIILRLSNSYGVNVNLKSDSWKLFANDIIKNYIFKKKKNIKILSNPLIKKDFLPSITLLKILLKVINDKKNINRQIFNVSFGKTYTLYEYAKFISNRLRKYYKKEIYITHGKEENISNYTLSNKKIINKGINIYDDKIKEIDTIIKYLNNIKNGNE